jgi:hypothetical protein
MSLSPETLRLIAEAKARVAAAKQAAADAESKKLGIPEAVKADEVNIVEAATSPANKDGITFHGPKDVAEAVIKEELAAMDRAEALQAAETAQRIALPTSFNPEQTQARTFASQGKSFCLIGAAGTGKTTITQQIILDLSQAAHVSPVSENTKYLNEGTPSIVVVGFTNKAVNNIRKRLPADLAKHCMTIHKLLEFEPVYEEVPDEYGGTRTTVTFEPARNRLNKLPHLATVVSEESSMTGTDLWGQLIAALPLPTRTQFIMLGDLNQIPPVFGPSILGFKLLELPIVELTHVYRQALESPIISLATAIRTCEKLRGSTKDLSRLLTNLAEPIRVDKGEHGLVTIRPWKQRVEWESALHMMKVYLPGLIKSGDYDPEKDMILCPFNKSFGTIELNKIVANYLGKQRNAIVYEIRARYEIHYLAEGDRVQYDRHDAVISKIYPSPGYTGKPVREGSPAMDRWGKLAAGNESFELAHTEKEDAFDVMDAIVDGMEEGKNLSSHTIEVYIPDLDRTQILRSAGDINKLLLGYALTVHKSQGSEWERVFLFLHNSHAKGTLLSRELLYTAVTRAKKELHIICEGDIKKGKNVYRNSIIRAAESPVITGITLAEKAEWFKGKADSYMES